MTKIKLPAELIEKFRREGAKGGKKAAQNMTPEQRKARAVKAAKSRKRKK